MTNAWGNIILEQSFKLSVNNYYELLVNNNKEARISSGLLYKRD